VGEGQEIGSCCAETNDVSVILTVDIQPSNFSNDFIAYSIVPTTLYHNTIDNI